MADAMQGAEMIAEAINNLAESVKYVARALDRLGTGDAATRMGAIENQD